jgi:hypothetical protein
MAQTHINPYDDAEQGNLCIGLLLYVLIGSFATSITLGLSGASLGMTALGYLAGGWAGFLVAVLTALAGTRIARRPSLPSLFIWARTREASRT